MCKEVQAYPYLLRIMGKDEQSSFSHTQEINENDFFFASVERRNQGCYIH